MFRPFLASVVLAMAFLLVPAVAHAQAADTTLTLFLGTWEVTVANTPIGAIHGTLRVAEDGLSTLSLTEMQVDDTLLTGVHAGADGLTANTSFFSPVSGMSHNVVMTLAPQADGSLDGSLAEGFDLYGMTAQRPTD